VMRRLIVPLLAAAFMGGCQEAASPPKSAAAPAPPVGLVPAAFQGDWDADAAACAGPAGPGRLAITPRELRIGGARGAVVSASQMREDEISLQSMAVDPSEFWTASHVFRLSPDGRALTEPATGAVRRRCPG
jgi:hypothetical protein